MQSLENFEIQNVVKKIYEFDERVEFIVLYGSIVEGRRSGLSDIDIAVYFRGDEKERFDFRVRTLGRIGDIFDVQVFQDLPLYLKIEIVRKGKILYYRDFNTVFSVYLQTIKEFEDFEKHLNTYYSHIGAGILEGAG